jgi:phenylacetate-coenzyme A ligase PaaK-like adenylate-forming protein
LINHLEIKKTLTEAFKRDTISEQEFNNLAIKVFHFQYLHNKTYQSYVNFIKKDTNSIQHYTDIPFLPIDFFKSKDIICLPKSERDITFTSSGTTGTLTSKHQIQDIELYKSSYQKGFELFYGSITNYCVLALLPSYLERTGSSLVYMFDDLIKKSGHPLSAFYLHNIEALLQTIHQLKQNNQKVLLLGVTYALLDLAESGITLNEDWILMETGGMKGKRKEMIKSELHDFLKKSFRVKTIHSEYGMTELLSQAYSYGNGVYQSVPWMKIIARDINDPFTFVKQNKTGGINVIDLANLYSCSFIETKDLGRINNDHHFEIMGRFDNSDLRGCNLMLG